MNNWKSPDYLKRVQYRDSANLNARIRLHAKYGRSDWYPWLASHMPWRAGGRYLDVGCGTAQFWSEMAPHLPADLHLVLVDLSEGMVSAAAKRLRAPDVLGEGAYASVAARTGNAESLPFEAGMFDGVLATHVLQHMGDIDKAVLEAKRVLKPQGTLLVAQNGPGHMQQLVALTTQLFGMASQNPAMQQVAFEKVNAALARHFATVDVLPFTDDLACTDPDDVVAYVLSVHHIEKDAQKVQVLRAAVDRAFNGGIFCITKDVKVLRASP